MKIPKTEHWAIIIQGSVYIPGDERSKTNPGHGYPEYYQEIIEYKAFEDFEEFKFEVARLTNTSKKFVVIKASPLKITTEISIAIA